MLARISKVIGKALCSRVVSRIFDTAPLDIKPGKVRFVSQLCHRDVPRYLLSIKSVYRFFGEGDIFIVDDGSLTSDDRAILVDHLREVEFHPLSRFDTGRCPRGNTWERLAALVEQAKTRFAVQVDADLVARRDIAEAVACYRSNRAFALGGEFGPGLVSFAEMSAWIESRSWANHPHIQVVTERSIARLAEPETRRYMRATSAFTGLPAGGVPPWEEVERFSDEMKALVGSRWTEWGTEQVTSNYVVANSAGATVLEAPRYVNNCPEIEVVDASLIHFFGTYRYYKGRYRRTAAEVIASLPPVRRG